MSDFLKIYFSLIDIVNVRFKNVAQKKMQDKNNIIKVGKKYNNLQTECTEKIKGEDAP